MDSFPLKDVRRIIFWIFFILSSWDCKRIFSFYRNFAFQKRGYKTFTYYRYRNIKIESNFLHVHIWNFLLELPMYVCTPPTLHYIVHTTYTLSNMKNTESNRSKVVVTLQFLQWISCVTFLFVYNTNILHMYKYMYVICNMHAPVAPSSWGVYRAATINQYHISYCS